MLLGSVSRTSFRSFRVLGSDKVYRIHKYDAAEFSVSKYVLRKRYVGAVVGVICLAFCHVLMLRQKWGPVQRV